MAQHPGRVSIIGTGTLGGTIAYSLLMGNHVKEILLVDRSNKIVQGQALDLAEASEGTDITVRAGTFKEAGQSTIVIVTADTPMNPHEDRDQWLIRSRNLLLSIASSMSPVESDIIILVASDPVDLYVQSFQSYFSHVPPSRIFGIGTTMATTRLNTWLSQMSSTKDAIIKDAYCIGNQANPVIVWNYAKVNDIAISTIPFLASQRTTLDIVVSNHRQKLICERKGQAWYGLAATITRLSAEILYNITNRKGKNRADSTSFGKSQPGVWVLSIYVPRYETCISWPVQINHKGIEKVIDLPLTSDEHNQLMQAVRSNLLDFQTSIGAI